MEVLLDTVPVPMVSKCLHKVILSLSSNSMANLNILSNNNNPMAKQAKENNMRVSEGH